MENKNFLSQMTAEENIKFNNMMQEMQKVMSIARIESIRMSREAQKASTTAFLNC